MNKFRQMTASILNLTVWQGRKTDGIAQIIDAANHNKGGWAAFCNVHMIVTALEDDKLAAALKTAKWIFPDGKPVALGLRLKTGHRADQVAGPATMINVCEIAAEKEWPIYLYGGAPNIIEELGKILPKRYPGLKIAGSFSPPFRPLSEEEEAEHSRIINKSGAKICFVALGCPKQECWMARNAHRVNPVMMGVGAAFPMEAGLTPRAPEWLVKCYLEWAYRLAQEPRRLWKRYAYTNPIFINRLLREVITR